MKKNEEELIQRALVEYLDDLKFNSTHSIFFTAIPNSTFTSSIQAKTKNILNGLRGGLPDLFLIINKKAFFIELKSAKGNPSGQQKKWIKAINDTCQLKAYVCYSLKEAIEIIENHLYVK